MREEPVKQFSLSGPGYYLNMEITKKGGKFFIDDKSGWRWDGSEDTFLTGLVRVQNSKMYDDFLKEIEECKEPNITKSDIKKAILYSLSKDKKDGLFPLLGDNRVREGWDDFTNSIWSDEAHEVKSCLKNHGYDGEKAEKIADDITERGASKLKSSRKNFDDYETELAKDFLGKGKSWKDVVKGIVNSCYKREKTVDRFIQCIGDETGEFDLDDPETQFERESEAWRSSYRVTQKDLKELSKKHNVPTKLLDHCSSGDYEVLEKYRLK